MTDTENDNLRLRRLLAMRCFGFGKLYVDDGELQYNDVEFPIDFKRDSVSQIEKQLTLIGRHKLEHGIHPVIEQADARRMKRALEAIYKSKRESFIRAVEKEYGREDALKPAETDTKLLYLYEAIHGYPKDLRPPEHLIILSTAVEDSSYPAHAAAKFTKNGKEQVELYRAGVRIAYMTRGGHWIEDGLSCYASYVLDDEWYPASLAEIFWEAYEKKGSVFPWD